MEQYLSPFINFALNTIVGGMIVGFIVNKSIEKKNLEWRKITNRIEYEREKILKDNFSKYDYYDFELLQLKIYELFNTGKNKNALEAYFKVENILFLYNEFGYYKKYSARKMKKLLKNTPSSSGQYIDSTAKKELEILLFILEDELKYAMIKETQTNFNENKISIKKNENEPEWFDDMMQIREWSRKKDTIVLRGKFRKKAKYDTNYMNYDVWGIYDGHPWEAEKIYPQLLEKKIKDFEKTYGMIVRR